ncbi:hypothetical protein V8D89_011149 [Ganoderma adspersum]
MDFLGCLLLQQLRPSVCFASLTIVGLLLRIYALIIPTIPYYHRPRAPATFVSCSLTYSGLSQLAPVTSSSVYIFERRLPA